MRHFTDIVLNSQGRPVAGATVTVYTELTYTTKATIYSDDGSTTTANPVTTDTNGRYDFYVADGRYWLSASDGTNTSRLADIEIADGLEATYATDGIWTHGKLTIQKDSTHKFVFDPGGFTSSDTSVNTMQECAMPTSMSGSGSVDTLMAFNVGTSGTALDSTRQRFGMRMSVNSAGSDKAVGVYIAQYGDTDGIYIGHKGGGAGQGFNGVVEDGGTAIQSAVFEGLPNASVTDALVAIKQHPTITGHGSLPAFSGTGLRVSDANGTVTLNAGGPWAEDDTGTSSPAIFIDKIGAGINLWTTRRSDGTALYADSGIGAKFCELALNSGQGIFDISGPTAAGLIRLNSANGQQARFELQDGGVTKYHLGKGTSIEFFLRDNANSRNFLVYTPGTAELDLGTATFLTKVLGKAETVGSLGVGGTPGTFENFRTTLSTGKGITIGDLTNDGNAALLINSVDTTQNVIVARGKSSQSADIVSIQDSNAAGLFLVEATGCVYSKGAVRSAVNLFVSSGGTANANLLLGNIQQHALTENTTLAITNLKAGTVYTFIITQNAGAAKTFAWPATVHGGMTVSATLSSINTQQFVVSNNGTDLYPIGAAAATTGGTP